MLSLRCCTGLSLILVSRGSTVPASHCSGFSYCRAWALECWGFRSCGSWTLEPKLNSCGASVQLLHSMWGRIHVSRIGPRILYQGSPVGQLLKSFLEFYFPSMSLLGKSWLNKGTVSQVKWSPGWRWGWKKVSTCGFSLRQAGNIFLEKIPNSWALSPPGKLSLQSSHSHRSLRISISPIPFNSLANLGWC